MTLTRDQFAELAARANLSPSVHNTQPARWHLATDGSILVAADLSRHLPAGDPQMRDMGVSCGAAVEGTVLALSEAGHGPAQVEDLWLADDRTALSGHRLAARILPGKGGMPDPLAKWLVQRRTWRGKFSPATAIQMKALSDWAAQAPGITLVQQVADIALLADLGDSASLGFLRDPAFRAELLDWMRLDLRDPRYLRDGMNREALGLGAVEAFGARFVLGGLFPLLDRIGLAKSVTAEPATLSASAIALVHAPADDSDLAAGRLLHRLWLGVTSTGLSCWPLAALADDADARQICAQRFSIPGDRRLFSVLRIGLAGAAPDVRARLEIQNLLIG